MIPQGTGGATLRIIATDESGNTETFVYTVGGFDIGGSNKGVNGGFANV